MMIGRKKRNGIRRCLAGWLLLGLLAGLFGLSAAAGTPPVPLGEGYVIYSPHARASFGVPELIGSALTAAKTERTEEGKAICENGALVFEIGQTAGFWYFRTGEGYLATNNAEELFLSPALSDTADNCGLWFFTGSGQYLVFNSKTARYKDRAVNIEYYSSVFSGWTYSSSSPSIFEFEILPLAAGEPVSRGVVNKPSVSFKPLGRCISGQPFSFTVRADSLFGLGPEGLQVEAAGVPLTADEHGVYTLPGERVSGESLLLSASGTDGEGVPVLGEKPVTILDIPAVLEVSPGRGAAVKENLQPEISVHFANGGESPLVYLRINGEDAFGELEALGGGEYRYIWKPEGPLSSERVSVSVSIVRADGKTARESWNFSRGRQSERLFFGQLHSHTTYSDGAGTLSQALDYIAALPEADNLQFVAFTDHSNYFDSSTNANPEGALYDMNQAAAASRERWAAYQKEISDFNATHEGILAIGGFEMTWSGGPGHINTFGTPGIVSRNNAELNRKDGDAGLKAYYRLLSQPEGAGSISQFNHPSEKFGTFADFAYRDPVIDDRIFLVEVGNGSGQIGSGGYYPSYEMYTLALDKGWHLAPSNNQDNHSGRWGNANTGRDVVLADSLSQESLFEAIRAYRVYATEDQNLELYYTANGKPLGSVLPVQSLDGALEIELRLFDPDVEDGFRKAEVIVDGGKTAYTWEDAAELKGGYVSCRLEPSYTYYYIRVTQNDGELAVTAPVWVDTSTAVQISSLLLLDGQPAEGESLQAAVGFRPPAGVRAQIKSITGTLEGSGVISEDKTLYPLEEGTESVVLFSFTPQLPGYRNLTVTALVEQDGKEYVISETKQLIIRAAGENAADSSDPENTGDVPAEKQSVNWLLIVGIVLTAAGMALATLLVLQTRRERRKKAAGGESQEEAISGPDPGQGE